MALKGHGERAIANGIAARSAGGGVFYFQSRELRSGEPHFFIVVNRDPIATKLLLLTIVTSKVDKVRIRNRERPHTVVEISPKEYDEFKVLSAVDCNVVLEKSLSELAGLVRRKEVRYHKDLSPETFGKTKAAPSVVSKLLVHAARYGVLLSCTIWSRRKPSMSVLTCIQTA